MCRCKVAVPRSDIFELASCRIDNLHVARYILITVDFAEVAKRLICDIGQVKLMIAFREFDCQHTPSWTHTAALYLL